MKHGVREALRAAEDEASGDLPPLSFPFPLSPSSVRMATQEVSEMEVSEEAISFDDIVLHKKKNIK